MSVPEWTCLVVLCRVRCLVLGGGDRRGCSKASLTWRYPCASAGSTQCLLLTLLVVAAAVGIAPLQALPLPHPSQSSPRQLASAAAAQPVCQDAAGRAPWLQLFCDGRWHNHMNRRSALCRGCCSSQGLESRTGRNKCLPALLPMGLCLCQALCWSLSNTQKVGSVALSQKRKTLNPSAKP